MNIMAKSKAHGTSHGYNVYMRGRLHSLVLTNLLHANACTLSQFYWMFHERTYGFDSPTFDIMHQMYYCACPTFVSILK